MPIRTFVLKLINNERTILTHHEIIDRIAKKIVPVISKFECQIYHSLIHLSSITFVL